MTIPSKLVLDDDSSSASCLCFAQLFDIASSVFPAKDISKTMLVELFMCLQMSMRMDAATDQKKDSQGVLFHKQPGKREDMKNKVNRLGWVPTSRSVLCE
ncbi:hypothetical protein SK128_027292, partial [Halocaridina rubra]